MLPKWLDWMRRLQATSQTGLAYARNEYDIERYQAVMRIAAEIAAAHTAEAYDSIDDMFSEQVGYATPKIDVRGAVFLNQRILLVRERADGLWTLPGGWADVGDTPAHAVEREISEEAGISARASKLLAVYDRDSHNHPPMPFAIYKLFFLCEMTGGTPQAQDETTAVGFFAHDELPPLSLGRVNQAQIDRCFAHHRDRALPTEFD